MNELHRNGNGMEEDARLTAYALGELEPEAAAEVEAALADDEHAAREVAEIRAMAHELEAALATERVVGLEEPRPQLVASVGGPVQRPSWVRRNWAVLTTLAASVLLVIGAVVWVRGEAAVGSSASAPFLYEGAAGRRYAQEPMDTATARSLEALGYGASVATGYQVEERDALVPIRDARPALGDEGRPNTEAYASIRENDFLSVAQNPLSTFSIDVDTASYANVRRFLREGRMPPPDAVRIEELVNYFRYDYRPPVGGDPFAVDVEVASAPWSSEHRLVRIGLQGAAIPIAERRASNLVFLLDVSGSMNAANKLPLVKQAMRLLVDQLDERDDVAIVVYAGAAGVVLPPTSCADRPAVLTALERLSAGGSTNGGQGIRLAYRLARERFVEGGINRVILCTDGDFNVGTSSEGELVRLIEEQAQSGVFLTVLGFGSGNLKDSTMEQLADRGNGQYAYVDSLREARKVLVEQMGGTLVTIAKDVKIQVEMNPALVAAYRLIGYENRLLAAEDFNDDRVDAGEIGAGHTVTALYEVVPVGVATPVRGVDPLKYQEPARTGVAAASGELLTVKLRYKQPDGDTSRLLEVPVVDAGVEYYSASEDFRFAAAVAAFGMLLRESQHAGKATLRQTSVWASLALGDDPGGYRAEFLELVALALGIQVKTTDAPGTLGIGYIDDVPETGGDGR